MTRHAKLPWLGKRVGTNRVLARLDDIEDKLDALIRAINDRADLEEALASLKAADKTIDAIEPGDTP